MTYDGVINKPDLDEALEHYGIKGMKWRKKLKGLINKNKGKEPDNTSLQEQYDEVNRKSYLGRYVLPGRPRAKGESGPTKSRVNEGIIEGRKRVRKKRGN